MFVDVKLEPERTSFADFAVDSEGRVVLYQNVLYYRKTEPRSDLSSVVETADFVESVPDKRKLLLGNAISVVLYGNPDFSA